MKKKKKKSVRQKSTSERVSERGKKLPANERRGEKRRDRERERDRNTAARGGGIAPLFIYFRTKPGRK